MIYIYKCTSCNKSNIELEKSMTKEFTKEQLKCQNCGKTLVRDYQAEFGHKGTIIPEHMRGVEQTKVQFDYSRSPSGRKHVWTTGK